MTDGTHTTNPEELAHTLKKELDSYDARQCNHFEQRSHAVAQTVSVKFQLEEIKALIRWKSEAEQTIAMLKDEIQTLRHEARKMSEELKEAMMDPADLA